MYNNEYHIKDTTNLKIVSYGNMRFCIESQIQGDSVFFLTQQTNDTDD